MIGNVPALCIGRIMNGVTAGVANNVMGKSLDDTVPVEVSGQFGTLLNFYICLGFFFSYLIGGILPENEQEMIDDEKWRIIYLVPAFIAIAQIILLLIFFR